MTVARSGELDAAQRRAAPQTAASRRPTSTTSAKPRRHRDRRLDHVGAWDWRASAHGDSPEQAAQALARDGEGVPGDGRQLSVKLHAAALFARRARGRERVRAPTASGGEQEDQTTPSCPTIGRRSPLPLRAARILSSGADLSVGLYWSAESRYACM